MNSEALLLNLKLWKFRHMVRPEQDQILSFVISQTQNESDQRQIGLTFIVSWLFPGRFKIDRPSFYKILIIFINDDRKSVQTNLNFEELLPALLYDFNQIEKSRHCGVVL